MRELFELEPDEWGMGYEEALDDIGKERPAEEDGQALEEGLTLAPAVWQRTGNLGLLARHLALEQFPPSARRATLRRLEGLKAELGFEDAPEIERVLIEQVLSCWLQAHLAEVVYGPTALNPP